jgi:hypothetical protein
VAQVLSESRDAASKARRSAVITAFTLAAALAAGAAAAWGAALIGGRHRDENVVPSMRFSGADKVSEAHRRSRSVRSFV